MRRIIFLVVLLLTLFGCSQQNNQERLSTPINLRYADGLISFDSVDNATSYVLQINDEFIEINENKYTLNDFGSFQVRVKARAEGFSDSLFTERISFERLASITNFRYNYSIYSDFDLVVFSNDREFTIDSITLGSYILNDDEYLYNNNKITMYSQYIKTLSQSTHHFVINTNNEEINVYLTIIDDNRPYIVTHADIYSNLVDDIIIQFELFGGQITQIDGNSISSTDYNIEGSYLTIDIDFIREVFENDRNRDSIGLAYTLETGITMVVGFIFIYKQA